jgi:predicted phage terminase large subunit-like protein
MLILPRHLLLEAKAEKARRSLGYFTQQAWPILEPGEYQDGRHLAVIDEHLEAVKAGTIKRLIINIPPRTMKSLKALVMFPAWVWLDTPGYKFLTGSYSLDFAVRDAVKSRTIIDSSWYQAQRGYLDSSDSSRVPWGFQKDQNAKGYYINTAGGHRYTTSTTSGGTGEGGDAVIIDDPLSAEQGHSKAAREQAWRFYSETLSSRLSDRKTGVRILVMQRLHEQDPTGMLLAQENGYDHLFLPMTYNRVVSLAGSGFNPKERPTSIGWVDWRENDGELLWPDRLGPAEVAELSRDLGPYGTAGQLQQIPSPAGGGIFKRKWFDDNRYLKLPSHFDRVLASWDMAFKDNDGSDYVCGTVWGFKGTDSYLLDGICSQLSFMGSCEAVKDMAKAWPQCAAVLVEDKANGPAVMNLLAKQVRALIPVEPMGSKTARAYAVEPSAAAGHIHLPDASVIRDPEFAKFVKMFISQAESFPNGANDDAVDSFTQAHNWAWLNGIKRFVTAGDLKKAAR